MGLGGLVVGVVHLLLLLLLCIYASAIGFSTDLIHRDSPLSPLYNPSRTDYDRFQNAIERSLKRVNNFNRKIEAPLTCGRGEYYMKVSLGTPPVEFLGIADTGSDLTWTQCLPCDQCFKQTLPLFNPDRSSSHKTVSCDSDSCTSLSRRSCGEDSTCEYSYGYGDGSFTKGDLAIETFTIGDKSDGNNNNNNNKNSSSINIVFGCGHSNRGYFEESVNGIVGLGGGKLSLVSQLGANGRKFSYCLTLNPNSTSKISFGSDAAVTGAGVVTTPIATKRGGGQETFYYLTLKSFTVGSREIAFAQQRKEEGGNIIIDSGTTLTMVPRDVLDDLVSALEEAISLPKVDDPRGQFQLCYSIAGGDNDNHHRRRIPDVIANFEGGDVVLKPVNMFSLVTESTLCLAMVPSDTFSIFGNLAQIGFLIGYDLDAPTLSFLPSHCAN